MKKLILITFFAFALFSTQPVDATDFERRTISIEIDKYTDAVYEVDLLIHVDYFDSVTVVNEEYATALPNYENFSFFEEPNEYYSYRAYDSSVELEKHEELWRFNIAMTDFRDIESNYQFKLVIYKNGEVDYISGLISISDVDEDWEITRFHYIEYDAWAKDIEFIQYGESGSAMGDFLSDAIIKIFVGGFIAILVIGTVILAFAIKYFRKK